MTDHSSIWIIGYPKSGNTWLSYLCSYCFNLPFIDFGAPDHKPQQKWIREVLTGTNRWDSLSGYLSVQKTHLMPKHVPIKNGIVIYILRDPRDVFVSYENVIKSGGGTIAGKLRFELLGLLGRQTLTKWFINDWKKHVIHWSTDVDAFVMYEELLFNGTGYLSGIFNDLNLGVPLDIVERALTEFSFEKMSGGRQRGQEDKKSFFRKGIAGDWINHLNNKEATMFEAVYQEVTDKIELR